MSVFSFKLAVIQYWQMNAERVSSSIHSRSVSSVVLEDEGLYGTNRYFQHLFYDFLKSFSRENIRIYHRQLQAQLFKQKQVLTVELSDLKAFDEHLYDRIENSPLEMIKFMQETIRNYVEKHKDELPKTVGKEWQVSLCSDQLPRRLRDINSRMVSQLFSVNGIIISATKPYIKASKLKLKCRNCMATKEIQLAPGESPYIPVMCQGIGGVNQKCPYDPFVALPDSEVIDAQSLKIQENPEDVPTGEIARTYHLVADRDHVSKCVPGDRVHVTGIMFVHDLKTENLSKGYLYITGIQKLKERTNFYYTEEEEEEFKMMAKDSRIREKIYKSIAPGIFGNDEIKKAIACMLFGGSRKHLPDKTLLRGDINVLLIGDPSTAKSQFLKFVEQTASIAVYTSGKGSSAAGLTASITKDNHTGEFQIEGGALVLADGGIVCIDEFDKMKPQDRVAIHEAMEQQTISIAKAGITTRLNSRTSILAAANPLFGRYDDFKQIADQIELQTTILSRFDCIFVVRDINTAENNSRIANHILNLHQGKISRQTTNSELSFQVLKKYIKYSRTKVNPRLSAVAAEKLQSIYVTDRQKAIENKKLTQSKNSIPITVRQLQAIIRLSESLARMKLKSEAGVEQVDQAHYLFELSTLKTIEGKEFGMEMPENVTGEIQKLEELLRKRICIGNQVSLTRLSDELSDFHGEKVLKYAINNMVRNGELREIKGKKLVIRER